MRENEHALRPPRMLVKVALTILAVAISPFCLADEFSEAVGAGNLPKVQELLSRQTNRLNAAVSGGPAPVIMAAREGRVEVAGFLLDQGANANAQDADGVTALHWAALRGHSEIITLLLKYKADANAKTKNGETPLHWAVAANGNEAGMRLLIQAGASLNTQDSLQRTPLLTAVLEMRTNAVQLLIANGAELDAFSAAGLGHREWLEGLLRADANLISVKQEGLSLLHVAAAWGQKDVISWLLSNGADVNASNELNGAMPLHLAARFGQVAAAKSLLDKGALVNAAGIDGQTPLLLAVEHGHLSVVELLLDSGARVDEKDKLGRTTLHMAAINQQEEMLEFLLAKKADVNANDQKGNTPLHAAVEVVRADMVQTLLTNGANVNARGQRGRTPLHFASSQSGDVGSLVKVLLDAGGKINLKDRSGNTPLHLAVRSRNIELIEQLLAGGANVNAWNWRGETPTKIALQEVDNDKLLDLLRRSGGRGFSAMYWVIVGGFGILISVCLWWLYRKRRVATKKHV